jgi:hypothetical protein
VTADDATTTKTSTIVFDAAAPTLSTVTPAPATPDGDDGWYVTPVTLALDAVDNFDAAPAIEFRIDDGPWTPYTAGVAVPEGEGTVEVRATDTVGNQSPVASWDYKVDLTAPTLAPALSAAREFTPGAADAHLAGVEYALSGQSWQAYTGPVLVPAAVTAIRVRAVDDAGNLTEAFLDTVASGPVSAVAASPDQVRPGSTLTLTGSGFGGGELVTGSIGGVAVALGRAAADGTVVLTATIPASVAQGYQVVQVTGSTTGASAIGGVTVVWPAVTPGTVAITGTARVGELLTASPGTWTPTGADLAYQWLRDGSEIAGATSSTYRVAPADAGASVGVRVTGSAGGYSEAVAAATPVTPAVGVLSAPVPTVSGTARIGAVLSADPGAWTPAGAGITLSFAWLRAGTPIPGATSTTYTVRVEDLGASLAFQVSGAAPGYGPLTATSPAVTVGGTPSCVAVSPTQVQPGGTLPLAGSGFGVSEFVTASIGGVTVALGRAAADGTVSLTATIPASAGQGYHVVQVTGTATGANAIGGLTVTWPSVTPATVTITGTARVGSLLTASPGTWTPAGAVLGYQWLRDGSAIPGATSATYRVLAADAGASLSVQVTGAADGYTPATASASAVTPGPGTLSAPVPQVSGQARIGATLAGAAGTWGPESATITLTYAWLRDGVPIAGASSPTYTVRAEDYGAAITLRVSGTAAGYIPASAISTDVTVSDGAPAPVPPRPAVIGEARVGGTLSVDPGTWEPASTVLTYRWLRDGSPIADAEASTYVLTAADAGHLISAEISGTAPGYAGRVTASAAIGVGLGTMTAPAVRVTGTGQVGTTLTAVPGGWQPADAALAYQWVRAGLAIPGATSASYRLTEADAGAAVVVEVTGQADGYTPLTVASGAIIPPLPQPEPEPTPPPAPVWAAGTIPVIDGLVQVGNTVTASLPVSLTDGVTVAYQWLRDGEAIPGASSGSYRITGEDFGRTISYRVSVVGGRTSGTSVTSAAYMPAAGRLIAPAQAEVEGFVVLGETLVANPGAWGPVPVALTYAWLRDGVAIPGAAGPHYTLSAADAGHSLTVRVIGSAPGFQAETITSAAFGPAPIPVEPAPQKLKVAKPKIKGTAKAGKTLKITRGTWTSGTTFTYQWLRNGKAIKKATKATYKLVKADIGKQISVKVTGKKAGFTTASSTSAKTKKVKK